MTIDHQDMLIDNSTTFERFSVKSYHSECVLKQVAERTDNRERVLPAAVNYFTRLSERSAFTNFEILSVEPALDIRNSFLEEDFDFYIPLKPKASFKLKAQIKSVTKFTPKPYFD